MKVVMLIGLLSLSACGMSGGYDIAHFYTAEGAEAHGDYINNLITNAKASADTRSAAYELRMQQEVEETNRLANRKSLFGGLFSSQKEQTK